MRDVGAESRTPQPRTRDGARLDDDCALFFEPFVWLAELPQKAGRGITKRGTDMMLAHHIRLDPTQAQEQYFRQAAGTARFVWNWALAQWNAEYAQRKKPSGMKLKKQFNAMKYEQFPWLHEIHRDAHAQPFANLQRAWARYFSQKVTISVFPVVRLKSART